ncbi:MAG TPA: hypothetical protein VNV37_12080 [Solirubrobacteraceae bacterium]|jgi:hypothetical protein|nr:hypothetical protein [Solirubrobacteraceae bacterium]
MTSNTLPASSDTLPASSDTSRPRPRRCSYRPASPPVLARYTDRHRRRPREVLALAGRGGSVLVVDRDALDGGDRRLLAHLGADEPLRNAQLVCRDYLRDPRAHKCRALAPEDLRATPFAEVVGLDEPREHTSPTPDVEVELRDRHGRTHRLQAVSTGLSIPELRWCRREPEREPRPVYDRRRGDNGLDEAQSGFTRTESMSGFPRTESMRDAIACMESYEPVRALTAAALARHRDDQAVSVTVLGSELRRLDASRIVLNRGLRRAVLNAMRTQGVSLSEIAYRCGRVKRDGKGNCSGETSWLSRRVGIAPEGGGDGEPTPWIHSDVLALIARDGLGISPHEVEL